MASKDLGENVSVLNICQSRRLLCLCCCKSLQLCALILPFVFTNLWVFSLCMCFRLWLVLCPEFLVYIQPFYLKTQIFVALTDSIALWFLSLEYDDATIDANPHQLPSVTFQVNYFGSFPPIVIIYYIFCNNRYCRPQSMFFPLIKVSPQFLIMGIFTLKPKILRINKI